MITNTLTRNLLRNTSFYTLVGLLPSLTGLISLPITSRFLSPDEFGVLSLIATFSTMITIVGTLQIYSSVSRLYFDFSEEQRLEYFSSLFYLSTLIGCAFFILIFICFDRIITIIYSSEIIRYKVPFLISTFSLVFRYRLPFRPHSSKSSNVAMSLP